MLRMTTTKFAAGLIAVLLLTGCTVKPEALSTGELASFGDDRLRRVTAEQEPISGPVDIYEAMARALKYNLDTRVEVMESALRLKETDLASYAVLPKLVAQSGYAGRDHTERGSISTSDPSVFTADLTLSWNILDFGLSYVRAKQAADKVLMQDEIRRKVVNTTIEDVRTAFWRAYSYDRLINRARSLEGRVRAALRDSRALQAEGNTSPIVALSYERELIQIQRELENLEGQLRIAKSQLAALINVRPETQFTLAAPERRTANLDIARDYHQLYHTALRNRPEMHELAYQMRVNDREMDAALLQLLPGFNLYAGANYDSNDFLTQHDWLNWGARASWNLLNVFSIPATKAKVEAQGTMLDARSLSVAMSIITQVHVSRVRFLQARKEYNTAAALTRVQNALLKQVRVETDAQRTSQQILIREEMNALVTEAKLDMAYADMQNAYANVYASIGIDPFPVGASEHDSVKVLAGKLRKMWHARGQKPSMVLNQL
jgi:outer membrane protein TolC